jgi:acyl transferase domain-containing protein/surfactin synthase thioesterase subunit
MSVLEQLSVNKRALIALQKSEREIERLRNARTEPIAVVGIGCRFPGGAVTPKAFWDLLEEGRDAVNVVPPERRRLFEALGVHGSITGGFLDDIDKFDASFFGISPREAVSMDPAQRILLEVTVEAIENAGIPLASLRGSRTGTFIGFSGFSGYGLLTPAQVEQLYGITGLSISVAAGRVAYVLDLQGPCISLDTACCSSLVAVHQGAQNLRSGECDVALVAGVNIISVTAGNEAMLAAGALSAQGGRCRAFDAEADGYVRSEGCGAIVLKRQSDAVNAGDRILGLLVGSAVKHDGRSNGLTAPSGLTQRKLLKEALTAARLAPGEIDYIETHGTGTPLGDPIELDALADVFAPSHTRERPLVLGSVKTNIGHPEGAAGIAGLIKVLGMFARGKIPQHLHFKTPNPRLHWDALPFLVPRETMPWRVTNKTRVAGISAFGFNGTISHAILTEPSKQDSPAETPPGSDDPLLLPISAKTAGARKAYARSYLAYLDSEEPGTWAEFDIAHSASLRRDHYAHRIAVVGRNRAEWSDALRAYVAGEACRGVVEGEAHEGPVNLAFVFSGQGPQWWGMGRQLWSKEPVFRAAVEACHEHIAQAGGPSLLDELFCEPDQSRLAQTEVAQPALFALQVGLARLWQSWGVSPDTLVGHSIGEVAAAHLAGVLSLEQAAQLVTQRGRIMQRATGQGRMLSVALSAQVASRIAADHPDLISVGASNAPLSTVLSGDAAILDRVRRELEQQGIETRWLPVDYAFHSPQMRLLGDELESCLAGLSPQPGRLSVFSTVTGAESEGTAFDAAYWGRQIHQPVLFDACIQSIANSMGPTIFLEIGPHPVLAASMAQTLESISSSYIVSSLRRNEDELSTLLESLGRLYCFGYPLDWSKRYTGGRPWVPLPTYPWQHESHWLQAPGELGDTEAGRAAAEPCYSIEWQVSEPATSEEADGGAWLILADRGGRSGRLRRELEARGHTCIEVSAGETYLRLGPGEFRINPAAPEDFARLLLEPEIIAAIGHDSPFDARGIVQLWSADNPVPLVLESIRDAQEFGALSALHLVQAILRAEWKQLPRLVLVTSQVQAIENGSVAVAQSPLWGLGLSIGLEIPDLSCILVDLDGSPNIDGLADEIVDSGGEDRIARRGARRYVARLVPHPASASAPVSLRSDATYLVAGGLGGIGLKVVAWMAARGAQHFALLGRTEPQEAAKQVLETLREQGCDIRTFAVDVADREALRGTMNDIASTMPPLAGVMHAAGLLDIKMIAEVDVAYFRAMARAKLEGAWNLHELTQDRPLDFFVLFSSVASLFGSPGQASYSSANSFLDALSHHRHKMGLPALSLNWTAWSDVGMATPVIDHASRYLAAQGMGTVDTASGMAILERVLTDDYAPQIGIVPLIPSQLPRSAFFSALLPPSAPATSDAPRMSDRILAHPREEWPEIVEEALHQMFAKALRIPAGRFGRTDPLQELGMDSLIGIELRRQVQEQFGVTLLASEIAAGASVHALAQSVVAKFEPSHVVGQANSTTSRRYSQDPGALRLLTPDLSAPAYRLLCFPGAAGSADDYAPWVDLLPDDWQLMAVEYPGSGRRREISADHPLSALTLQVTGGILALSKVPTVLFGHSLGALVAHATALELERHARAPVLVVLSNPANVILAQRNLTHERLRDIEFLTALARSLGISVSAVPGRGQQKRRFFDAFGHQVAWTLDFDPAGRISCPVVIARSADDGSLDPESLDFWRRSGGQLDEWTFVGGHHYVRDEPSHVVAKILERERAA